MIINKLLLINFKSHSERAFEFSPQINCFVGNNGVGKTNVLDALHYLSVGKSFLGNSDINNVKSDEDFFVIESEIQNEEKEILLKFFSQKNLKNHQEK
jgi:DNA replication and repair protein RecF